jgi:hypothetical protein
MCQHHYPHNFKRRQKEKKNSKSSGTMTVSSHRCHTALFVVCVAAMSITMATAFSSAPVTMRHLQTTSRRSSITPEDSSILPTPQADTAKSLSSPSLKDDYETLLETVETRKVHPDKVHSAMTNLEKLSYRERWTQSTETAERMAQDLKGDWRPIFSSGTTITQARLGGRALNYFPIKAVISLRPEEGKIQNGLYIGEFYLVRLNGTCQYEAATRRFHFSFHYMSFLNGAFEIHLKEGQDTDFALAVGVGGHIGLWNMLLADQKVLMARGAAKAITLWKRIDGHKAVWW